MANHGFDPATLDRFDREAAEPCQAPRYVLAAARQAGWECRLVEARTAAAFVPVRRVGPFSQVVLPPFAPYSGLFPGRSGPEASGTARGPGSSSPGSGSDVDPGDDLDGLAARFETSFDDIVLHLEPGSTAADRFASRGWSIASLLTYRLDPRAGADPATWSASAARNFRSHADCFDVRRDDGDAGRVAALCADRYRLSGRRPPLSPDRIASLAREMVDLGMASVWTARDRGGVLRGGVILLTAGKRSSYWLAGSEPGHAMTILVGRIFQMLVDLGIDHFDFVGANTPSIAEFKRRFGGSLTRYAALRITPNRLLSRILAARRVLRSRVLAARRDLRTAGRTAS